MSFAWVDAGRGTGLKDPLFLKALKDYNRGCFSTHDMNKRNDFYDG